MIDFLITLEKKSTKFSASFLFVIQPAIKLSISNEEIEFLAWGDPICDNIFKNKLLKNKSVDFIVNNLYGHYYYLLFDKIQNTICAGNSLFSILPVYYYETSEGITISNNPFHVGHAAGLNKYSKRFLLENILFNYPLFNESCIEGVMLLRSNHYIEIYKGAINYLKHTAIENYFARSPHRWRNAVEKMSDLFIECSDKYFPDYLFASALTGGFDGRTLVSCCINKKKDFFTYSFGNEESSDIPIAGYLSKKYNLAFHKIMLDDNYLKDFSLNEGLSFIKGSSGIASFARAHYLFATKILTKESDCLITGNFGSEVLRAPNNIGVVFSKNLNIMFKSVNFDSAFDLLKSSAEYDFLNIKNFADEMDSLKEDLKKLPCFDPVYKQLSKNQQFYIFIFEEIFRKYFGAEMVNQFKYLSNRTPFLDIDFLKGILGTELSGVTSDFYSLNPLKRFKGQVLYANIINKTFPAFGSELTDKGYKPDDLLNLKGKIKITSAFINRKINSRLNLDWDPFAVKSSYSVNRKFWESNFIDPDLFSKQKFEDSFAKNNSDILFIALSQAWFRNQMFK